MPAGSSPFDCRPKLRKDVRLKPWILFLPDSRSPRRMRKRKESGKIIAKVPDTGCERGGPQHMILSVASYQQGEPHRRQQLQELIAPQMHAFRSRGSIAATRATGIAEAHRHYGDRLFVVKFIGRQAHPFTQPVSGDIGERHACLMHFGSWSLACDEDGCARGQLQDRPRAERQSVGASAACPHLRQQCGKLVRAALLAVLHPHFLSHNCFTPIGRLCR